MSNHEPISLLANEVVAETPFLLEEEKDVGAVLYAMANLLEQRTNQNALPMPSRHESQTALTAACAKEATRLLESMEKQPLFVSEGKADQMAERIRDLAIIASTGGTLPDSLPVRISRAQQTANHRTTEHLKTNPTGLTYIAYDFRQWQNGPSAFAPATIEEIAALFDERCHNIPLLEEALPIEKRDAAKRLAYRRSAGFLCTELAKGKRILPAAQLEEINPLLFETFAKGGLHFGTVMETSVQTWQKHLAENTICFMVDALKGKLPEGHPQNGIKSIQEIKRAEDLLGSMFRQYNAIVIYDNHGGCLHDLDLYPSRGLYQPAENQNLTRALKAGAGEAIKAAFTVGGLSSLSLFGIGELFTHGNLFRDPTVLGFVAGTSLIGAAIQGKNAFQAARNSGVSVEPDRVDLFSICDQPHDPKKKTATFRSLEQRI